MSEQLSGELLEVVDEHDRLTGEILDKNIIHAAGLLHRVAHVFITDGQHLLQQRRKLTTKLGPGRWDASASGHVDPGESYLDAIRRELDEEVGLRLPANRFREVNKIKRDEVVEGNAFCHRVFGTNFVVFEPRLSLEGLRLAKGEVIGSRLYSIDQLEADLRSGSTAKQHVAHPPAMWASVIRAMRQEGGR